MTSPAPKFSISIPVGAWHPLFPRVLDSIASQSVPLSVALLDASGDHRVRDAAEASGIQFAHHRTGPDGGQSAAIIEGWENTDGDILAWLNADDMLSPQALTHVSDVFAKSPDTDVVYGESDFVDDDCRPYAKHEQVEDISDLIYRSNLISQPSCFFRRSAVDAIHGLDASLHYVMDWDLWMRLYRNGAKFERLCRTLSQVYIGTDTKTSSRSFDRIWEVAKLVNRHAGPIAAIKSAAAVYRHQY